MTVAADDASPLPICPLAALDHGQVRVFELGRDLQGRPLRGILFLDPHHGLRAFLDRCRHLPVPLDAAERYLADDGQHLVCMTHGARFRVRDGLCVEGPCQGLPLWALPVQVMEGVVHIDRSALPAILRRLI